MRGNCSGVNLHLLDFMPKTGQDLPQTWYVFLLYSIEIFILILDQILAVASLKLLTSTCTWHFNLNCIFSFIHFIQIPAHIGRVIFIFQEIIYGIRDGDCNFAMILSTFCQLCYVHIICHIGVAFAIERLFALYYIEDYEKRRRPAIPIIIIATLLITAVFFSKINISNAMALDTYAIYIIVVVMVGTVLFYVMTTWNKRLTKKLELSRKVDHYTLSKRFQLAENMRILRLCKGLMSVVGVLCILISGIVLYLVLVGWTPMGVILFELIKSSCPTVVMIASILKIDKWKTIVKNWLNIKKTAEIRPLLQPEDETEIMKQDPLRLEFAIAAGYCFVQNFSSGILTNSLWPYLKLLDPSITESFFGYIVGAASVTGLISNIVCGFIATRHRDVRLPISVGITLMILGNLVYFNLEHFKGSYRYAAMISRLLSGMSAGNSCLISTFVALSANKEQLPRAIALTSCGSTLGMLLGPALQNFFTVFDYPGTTIMKITINQYNAPALAAVFINIVGLFVIYFLKSDNEVEQHEIDDKHSDTDIPENSQIDVCDEIFHFYGLRGIPICLATRFVQMFVLSMMDTIGASYTMFMFGWDNSQALLYGSRSSLVIGIIALTFHTVFTLVPAIRWKNHVYGCIFALTSFSAYFLFSYPWGFIHDGRNEGMATEYCQNSTYAWCQSVSTVSTLRFYLPYYLFITIACCILSLSNSTCLTQFAGREYQGIAQSLQQVASYSANIFGSIIIGKSFTSSGPSSVWFLEFSMTISMALIWTLIVLTSKTSLSFRRKYEVLRSDEEMCDLM